MSEPRKPDPALAPTRRIGPTHLPPHPLTELLRDVQPTEDPSEVRRYLRLIRSAVDSDRVARDEVLNDPIFAPVRFIRFAWDQRVCTLVGSAIRSGALPLDLPPDLRKAVFDLVSDQERRDHVAREMLHELHTVLTGAGICFSLLKGLALSHLYDRVGLVRATQDIDILVPISQRTQAVDRLIALGFEPQMPLTGHTFRTRHAVGFTRRDLSVDLHWTFPPDAPNAILAERAIASRCDVCIGTGSFAVLDDEHTLLLLALGLIHDIGRGAPRSQQLFDLYAVLRRSEGVLDWAAVAVRRRADRTHRAFFNALHLAVDLLNAPSLLPQTSAALTDAAGSLRVRTSDESARLILYRPDQQSGRLWSYRVQDSTVRYLAHAARRTLAHPMRLPILLSRAARWGLRYGVYRWRGLFGSSRTSPP